MSSNAVARPLGQVPYITGIPGLDFIADLHGCFDELLTLLEELGYTGDFEGDLLDLYHPDGRRIVFLGDLTDGGPKNLATLRFVRKLLEFGHFAAMGNHDDKLRRALKGNPVRAGRGLQATLKELESITEEERASLQAFLESLPHQLTFVVNGYHPITAVHAGMPYEWVGEDTNEARSHALYGEHTGERDAQGYPLRGYIWTEGWAGVDHFLIHGHDFVPVPTLRNNAIAIDTGPVEGGSLTALRWPEMEYKSVKAFAHYREPRA